MNRIIKNSIFNVIYTFLNIAFPLITSMYISRVLQPAGVGTVAYAQTIASYFVSFACAGMGIYALREMAKARENPERRSKVFTELFLINAATTMFALIVYVVMVLSVERFRTDLVLFFCTGLLIVFQFLNIDWLYQGLEHYGYITARSFVVKVLSLVAIIFFVRNENDYIIYALISSLAIGGNSIFNIINARKYVKFSKNISIKPHLVSIIFIAIVTYLADLYSKIDITMLGVITTKENVGYYTYAHKIIEFIILLCVAVSTVLMPRLSLLYETNKEKFEKLVDMGIKVLVFITLPVFFGVMLLSEQAVEVLYGESFLPAVPTVRILALMILIKPLANLLCYQLMISTGNEKKRLPAFIAAVIINIGLNSFLIPMMQQNGAAIASVISELVVNLIQILVIIKIVKISFVNKTILKSVIAAAVMIPVVVITSHLSDNAFIQLAVAAASGVIVYFLVGILLKNELITLVFSTVRSKLKKGD